MELESQTSAWGSIGLMRWRVGSALRRSGTYGPVAAAATPAGYLLGGAGMNLITLAENLGTSVKMLEDHYVKLSDDATGEVVEAHGFKLGLRVMKAA
jgi:hypothetical protein